MFSRGSKSFSYVQHLEKRIENLERLLFQVCTVPSDIPNPTLTPKKYSGRGDVEDPLSPNDGHAPMYSRIPREHRALRPLPPSVYSKPEDMDPLSLLAEESSDSNDESFSEKNLGAMSQEQNGEHATCFYGKSSVIAFTSKAFDESGEVPPTSTDRTHAYRKEFWTTPDVIGLNYFFGCRSPHL